MERYNYFILDSIVMLYKWLYEATTSREAFRQTRGKSIQTCGYHVYYRACAQIQHGYRTAKKDWDAWWESIEAAPNYDTWTVLFAKYTRLFSDYCLRTICLHLFTRCTRWKSPLLTRASKHSGAFAPPLVVHFVQINVDGHSVPGNLWPPSSAYFLFTIKKY